MHRNNLLSYDVIVVGAGPAGLSVASELSKKHKVLVIDTKDKISDTKRSWFFPKLVNKNNPELRPFLYEGVRRLLTDTYTGAKVAWKTKLKTGYYYAKEHELLAYWGKIVQNNGSDILLKTVYKNHKLIEGGVRVQTTKGDFKARLLIDASGHSSAIKKKYHEKQYLFWWSIFGAIVKHPHGLHSDMKVGDYMLWVTFKDTNYHKNLSFAHGRPVLEYEVLDKNTSFVFIMCYRKKQIPVDVLRKIFQHVIKHEEKTKKFRDVKIKEIKYGWYPSGGLSQRIAENRVVFIGDAGCWTVPCGWGMGFILDNYKQYAKNLSKAIKSGNLNKKDLLEILKLKVHQKHELLMDQIAIHFLAHASVPQVDRFIIFFNSLGSIYCEKVFTLTINQNELRYALKKFFQHFSFKELIPIIPKEDYLLILEEAEYFLEDAVIEEVKSLLNKIEGKRAVRELKNGFDFAKVNYIAGKKLPGIER